MYRYVEKPSKEELEGFSPLPWFKATARRTEYVWNRKFHTIDGKRKIVETKRIQFSVLAIRERIKCRICKGKKDNKYTAQYNRMRNEPFFMSIDHDCEYIPQDTKICHVCAGAAIGFIRRVRKKVQNLEKYDGFNLYLAKLAEIKSKSGK